MVNLDLGDMSCETIFLYPRGLSKKSPCLSEPSCPGKGKTGVIFGQLGKTAKVRRKHVLFHVG